MSTQRYESQNATTTRQATTLRRKPATMPESYQQEEEDTLFKDLSFSTALASGLAAVTSLFLSSYIGLAGSVIGVAAAAVATSIATQVYKSVLSRSASKLKDLGDNSTSNAAAQNYTPNQAARTTYINRGETPVAPESLRAKAQQRHAQTMKRRVTVVAIIVAFVALLATAGIIMLATAGEGIGSKTLVSSDVEETVENTVASQDETPVTEGTPAAITSPSTPAASDQSTASTTGTTDNATATGTSASSTTTADATTSTTDGTDTTGSADASNTATQTETSASTSTDAAASGTSSSGDSTATSGTETGAATESAAQ